MNWELLTSPEFEEAVGACEGVCLLPVGVVEKHGDHLPLGQDTLYIHRVCTIAARKEPAMVFPQYYFGQILEAGHVPGTIGLRAELLLPLLENVCDEIGRNGFTRIIIANGHGGNNAMLGYFCMTLLDKHKPYMVFVGRPGADARVSKLREAKIDGHAGEKETSSTMYLYPELAKPARFAGYGIPLERLKEYRDVGLTSGIDWYADFPGHCAGEKVRFTKKKGEAFVGAHVRALVAQIRLVKGDDTAQKLYDEYSRRRARPANRYP